MLKILFASSAKIKDIENFLTTVLSYLPERYSDR